MVTSRGRPDGFAALYESWLETGAAARLVAVLDDDDPALDAYPRYPGVEYEVGPRVGHAQSLNRCALAHAGTVRIIGQVGDDHRFRTPWWDRQVSRALWATGIAYGDDLYQGVALPTAVWMTSDIVRALGQFCPTTLWHLYVDNYWRDLGVGAGVLRYLPGVVVEHLHPSAGKAESDGTYEESNNEWAWTHDGAAWEAYVADRLPADVAAVAALL